MAYKNPFGLAAGMDKRAEALRGWESLGLGFIEIGGVTAEEQPGNPKPRMFRSGTSKALVNRMGFNNPGSENIARKLDQHIARFGQPQVPLWANLGKSKNTPLTDAPMDYATTMGDCGPIAMCLSSMCPRRTPRIYVNFNTIRPSKKSFQLARR